MFPTVARSTLLVIATAAHQYAASSPNVRKTTRRAILNEKNVANGTGRASSKQNQPDVLGDGPGKTSFGETVTNTDEVHDSGDSFLSRQAVIKHWRMRIIWALVAVEVLSQAIASLPTPFSRNLTPLLCPSLRHSGYNFSPPSPTFLFFVSVTIFGSLLRHACFAALGRMFTFAHTTRADHILVTWGPYAYARHAGYTAVVFAYGGMIALLWQQDAWLRSCTSGLASGFVKPPIAIEDAGLAVLAIRAIGSLLAQSSAVIFSVWTIRVVFALLSRAPREDATLKRRFGKQWEAYQQRVPWRFVPYMI